MRTPGTYISAVGHVGLIGWLLFGGGFDSAPLPFDVADVSVVSGAEFAAIVARTTPQPGVADPSAPVPPQVEATPDVAQAEPAPQAVQQPTPAQPPDTDIAPPEAPQPPAPPADLADVAPVAPAPPAPDAAPDFAPTERPQPRPVDRVAPVPVAPPPPDADVADVVQDAVVPDDSVPSDVIEPAQTPTAPLAAATQIITEADAPSGAVSTSKRPQTRPNRPAPQTPVPQQPVPQTPAQTNTASSDNVNDAAVAAALADALAAVAPDIPAGPPLTGSEREGFRVAVNQCWNVDPGSEAARVTVVVAFSLDQSGRVQGDVRQVSADGGNASAASIAFQAARRAILRCGAAGYSLPADKHDQWRDVEITFDPSGMRLR